MNRYFLQAGAWTDNILTITGEEAHHATRVMRVKENDQIEIFDGQGKSAVCTITQATRTALECTIENTRTQTRPEHPIKLCQAIPKGGNMELIVQKAVELGVHSIQPLITTHTVARPEATTKKQTKWQRFAVEACKQCGQNYLPEIKQPLAFSQWIDTKTEAESRFVAALDPKASHFKKCLAQHPVTGQVELLIGPEGDFSPEEYQQAYSAGFIPVSLGDIVLRVETATLFALSVLQYELSAC